MECDSSVYLSTSREKGARRGVDTQMFRKRAVAARDVRFPDRPQKVKAVAAPTRTSHGNSWEHILHCLCSCISCIFGVGGRST